MTIQKIERIRSTFFYEHKKGENVKFPGCASEMIGHTSGITYLFNKRICSYQRFLIGI